MPYQPSERRPIAARRWAIWHRTSRWLVRRGVAANTISVVGMIGGVFAGGAFAATHWHPFAWFAAAFFIQLRLVANLLDGMVAIESRQASAVGELFNEVPDRVSDSATLIGAGYALGGDITLGYLAALAAIFTAYIRALGKAAGTPQEYCGPMAKQHRMALMTCVALYCGVAPTSWQPTWGLVGISLAIVLLGCLITSLRRLLRIAAYLR